MKRKIISIIFLITLFLIGFNTKVNASYNASNKTVNSGANVNITITSTKALENFDVQCTNTGGLTYKSCSSVTGAIVNSSGKKISYALPGGSAKTLGTYKFTAPKVTEKNTYTVEFNVNGTVINSKITVNPTTTNNNDNKDDDNKNDSKKSTNANLSTLGVTPKEYDFTGFNKDKTSYSVTVPSSVDKLNVAYKTADSKATAKVTGNTNLEVGTNNIKVVVTAEDGKTTKTYTIKVTKLATEDEKPGNIIDDDKDLDICLTSLSLKNLEITPAFASDVYSYEATINMDEKDFSDVVVNAVANDEKATIEITGNTNLVEGENLINVIVKSSNGNEKVYQITVNKVSQKSEVVSSGKIKKEHLIIGAYVFVLVIIFAVIIIKHIRNKKYEYEEDDETFDDTQEIDLNDTAEETHDNFIEELYKKRNNGEKLQKDEKEIMEDIEEENDRIFNKPKEGSTVEYDQNEIIEEKKEELLEDLRKKRKGKHF